MKYRMNKSHQKKEARIPLSLGIRASFIDSLFHSIHLFRTDDASNAC